VVRVVSATPAYDAGTVMMQPLGGLDAAFLSLETPTTPLHVGLVMILETPEGTRSLFSPSTRYAQIRQVVAQRLHVVAPFRQRAVRVPFGLHHPVWVDDPDFALDDHLSRASLPSPGGRAELDAFVASVMSRQLDPDRPLWEMFVVEGLAGDRTALVAKVHHAILDGVSGASMLGTFLDLTPRTRLADTPPEPWEPDPLPGSAQLLRYAAVSLTQQPARVLTTLNAGVEVMADLGLHGRELVDRGEPSPPGFFSAPRTSLNGAVSNRKRFASLSIPLEDVKLVRHTFGCTVNDVLLAGVAGGLRHLLAARHEPAAQPLVAMVPVSTRPEGEGDALGNQVSAMLVSLATDVEDPVLRLATIAQSTRVAKEQEQLHRGRVLGDLAQLAAPGLASRVARTVAATKLFDRMRPPFNVMVSGVKGPGFPLFCAGSRVSALYPVGPIAEGVGLNVTIFSYLDQLHVGLLSCRKLLPELDDLGVSIDDALGELFGCALDARSAVG
jgi:diacylglycerol O-acyltransferase